VRIKTNNNNNSDGNGVKRLSTEVHGIIKFRTRSMI